ncbi:hypothetical protein GCM10023321_72590 [Pseudonocardia eucalypti]|uniref:Uncharacterized protein n=1 Tax=Pseudonocardia eucalypti TaxID=648755 RepID=A0ABP9R763_9PSEU|nr:hypothetical protein [Pseudonocardia eucalypti]
MNPHTPTGTRRPAKSVWLAGHLLGAAGAGRGVVLIDHSGELARTVLDRLPAEPGTGWPAHGGEDR